MSIPLTLIEPHFTSPNYFSVLVSHSLTIPSASVDANFVSSKDRHKSFIPEVCPYNVFYNKPLLISHYDIVLSVEAEKKWFWYLENFTALTLSTCPLNEYLTFAYGISYKRQTWSNEQDIKKSPEWWKSSPHIGCECSLKVSTH